MTPSEQADDNRIGETVQSLRAAANLSLRALASRTGFSASFISQVEHGQASPSIASLEKIASALGVTLSEFFAREKRTAGEAVIVRAANRPQLTSGWSKAMLESLGPMTGSQRIEPVMMRLNPGGRSSSRPEAHHGNEFALVIEGEVRFTLGEVVHHLETGDSVTFSSEVIHQWENATSNDAHVILIAH